MGSCFGKRRTSGQRLCSRASALRTGPASPPYAVVVPLQSRARSAGPRSCRAGRQRHKRDRRPVRVSRAVSSWRQFGPAAACALLHLSDDPRARAGRSALSGSAAGDTVAQPGTDPPASRSRATSLLDVDERGSLPDSQRSSAPAAARHVAGEPIARFCVLAPGERTCRHKTSPARWNSFGRCSKRRSTRFLGRAKSSAEWTRPDRQSHPCLLVRPRNNLGQRRGCRCRPPQQRAGRQPDGTVSAARELSRRIGPLDATASAIPPLPKPPGARRLSGGPSPLSLSFWPKPPPSVAFSAAANQLRAAHGTRRRRPCAAPVRERLPLRDLCRVPASDRRRCAGADTATTTTQARDRGECRIEQHGWFSAGLPAPLSDQVRPITPVAQWPS
jgi:hypothetical protein